MLLICETCHRRWTLGRGQKRQGSCQKCRRQRRSVAATKRERLRRIHREGAGVADEIGATCTAEDLSRLMGEADSAGTRALDLARTIAARFRPGGT